MSVLSWHRLADDLTEQVRQLQADLLAEHEALTQLKDDYQIVATACEDQGEYIAELLAKVDAEHEKKERWKTVATDNIQRAEQAEAIATRNARLESLHIRFSAVFKQMQQAEAKLKNAESMMSMQLKQIQQAEAEVALRGRMLRLAWESVPIAIYASDDKDAMYAKWLADLRDRANKENT